ncbi:nuclease-related domain-containing protein [Actinomadura rubrisoli]|uniref:NERD domain-containing protein n=1 Tax=Actinomadura rubrisoli TaxID=2530368 RepID=A0A4R5B2T3_9ACTN|nr:nuclease-related domain-containing protein [Actinomadura rubrisoli]TDD79019.1 NERD domain-containing protein [Actinomadura rubrisoli]
MFRYRALAAEHRWERRVMRGLLACGAGVIAAGVSVWWAGPVVAVAAFAGHVVYTRVRPGPTTNWRRGAQAERRTGRRLARLDPAGYHVLHDRALPGASANLDHLVIGLTGVYAIASRRFRWGVPLRAEQHRLWVGKRPVRGVTGVAGRAAGEVAELLTGELDCDVSVTAVVVVHGARGARDGFWHRDVFFCSARMVPRAFAKRPVIFTSAQVTTIAAAAERLLPPMMEMLTRR